MIRLNELSVSYNKKTVLENISLDIASHLSILGANGSGKSTLAKALCSLIEYEGEISIDGQDLETFSPKERAQLLSYIPAKLEAYDAYITLFDFVLLGRFPFKKSLLEYSQEDRAIVRETLEYLNITKFAQQTIGSLSSGESQLALIAQALAQRSRIIIFDEPTANLDPKNAKIIAEHIKSLQKQSK